MNTIYLSDTVLEGVVGGAGQDVMSYNPTTGQFKQDFTVIPANSAAYGDTGSGLFNIDLGQPGIGVPELHAGDNLVKALN